MNFLILEVVFNPSGLVGRVANVSLLFSSLQDLVQLRISKDSSTLSLAWKFPHSTGTLSDVSLLLFTYSVVNFFVWLLKSSDVISFFCTSI